MFDLCLRTAKSVINYYIFYELDDTAYSVSRIFPSEVDGTYAARIRDFGFSCCSKRKAGERFVLVFTDADGSLEFVYCHRPTEKFALCLSSALPWFSCFHGLLDILWFNELYRASRWHILHPWLVKLVLTSPTQEPSNYFSCPDPFRAHQHLKFRIPNSYAPHNPKYMMEYYSAMDLSQWIHIFVRLILERSVLFYSNRLTRLTSCVLAAVCILYPLQWVHSFYPLIPAKAIEVLGCPSPFVAGIHTCNLEAAMEHVSPGTCLVNLDTGKVHFPPTADCSQPDADSNTLTPKAVFHFLRRQLKDIMRQVNSAFSDVNAKSHDWKRIDGDSCSFFEQLAKPFFCLLLNLLGPYKQFLVGPRYRREVDLEGLIAFQRCPDLEPFLHSFCDTQAVQMFLEIRSDRSEDFSLDAFDSACDFLNQYQQRQKRRTEKSSYPTSSLASLTPVALAETHNGGLLRTDSSLSVDSPAFVQTCHKQWIQAKKIRSPGELCPWDYDVAWTEWKSSQASSVSSNFINWTQKLRAQAVMLKNLSKSKDTLAVDAPELPTDNRFLRSHSSRAYASPLRPLSEPQQAPNGKSKFISGSCQRLDMIKSDTTEENDVLSASNQNGSLHTESTYKPPRPPPPQSTPGVSFTKTTLSKTASPQLITLCRGSCDAKLSSPDQKGPPPPLPPRPAWVQARSKTINHIPLPTTEGGDYATREHGFYRNSPITRSQFYRPLSRFNQDFSEPKFSPVKDVTPLGYTPPPFPSPTIDTFPMTPTSQLLLRRMNRYRTPSVQFQSPTHGRVLKRQPNVEERAPSRCASIDSCASLSPGSKPEQAHVELARIPDSRSNSFQCLAVGDVGGALDSHSTSLTRSVSGDNKLSHKRWATFSNVHEMKGELTQPSAEQSHQVPCLRRSWSSFTSQAHQTQCT